ncbi:uncharacterized protein LOC107272080 isoform X2 [Cephus cinctus]|uniref:Uncharacterized protein LOC107272080 isoform X2 n=1 Tax=Cephus cinctus TaxID=211228 RepID=A0AAJ7C9J2_CEPCN|nr:uncharacterized protein LOC107272080 isoform X2 [Cephus cinctus]
MAGGSGSIRQGGSYDRTNLWLYHHHLYPCLSSKPPTTESFKKRHRAETKRTCLKNIELLQENILRLLYSNLDLSQEERLLVELILNISCTVPTAEAPYTDETSHYKERSFKEIPLTTLTEGTRSILWKNCKLLDSNEANREDVIIDVSPMSSDMADSGLETGSASPRENSVSETSGMDLEESQAAEDISTDEDSNKITRRSKEARKQKQGCIISKHSNEITSCNDVHGVKSLIESAVMECISNDDATCSFDRPEQQQQQQLDSSGSSDENAHKTKEQSEEVSQYENRVLNDPFYESDCESDGNEQTNSFVPTESFEFIDPVNMSPGASDTEREFAKYEGFNKVENEKLNSSSEARSMTTEQLRHELSHSNDLPIKKSSSSTSSYYFIDASSLSDENEVLSMERTRDRHPSGRIASYISNSMDYVPSRSNNLPSDEQTHKYTARKQTSLQGGHERVAEFERELKLTEHLKPLAETRKVKRVDSTLDEKPEMDKGIEKEALVVEIKEADSGESTQASPCPDNSTSLNVMKDEISIVNNAREATSNVTVVEEEVQDKEDCEKKEDSETTDETRRPSLIRRNTFELDSNEETLSVLRQEYERRQGSLVFQNSIPQYSGHRVDGDSCFLPAVDTAVPILDTEPSPSAADISESGDMRYDSTMPFLLLDKVGHTAAQEGAENNCHLDISIENSNAVYPVIKSASDKFVIENKVELLDDLIENSSSSLPVNLNYTVEKEDRLLDLMKIKKRDERAPIVSGGASTSDYKKPTDSPIVRRKTESTPIVSGGSVIMNEPEVKAKPNRMSTSMTAWVVDMSGCNRSDAKSSMTFDTQEGMSQSFSSSDCIKSVKKCKSQDRQHGSLGFFVNLSNMETKKMTDAREAEKKEQNGTGKQYCEFYIDMSGKSDSNAKCKKQETVDPSNNKNQSVQEGNDKKNIFSMFIDLSEPSKKNGNETSSESCKGSLIKVYDKKVEADQSKVSDMNESDENGGSGSAQNHCIREQRSVRDNSKPSVFMFIESDSPVVRRRTLSSSRPVFKRHSWNVDKSQSASGNGHVGKELLFRKEHKRAHSLSVDRGDIRRIQTKGSNSSHSLSEVARADTLNAKNPKRLQEQDNGRNMDTSSEDVFEFDTRDTPPNSHIEIVNEELRVSVKHHDYKELISSEVEENMEISDVKLFEEEYSEVSVWDKTGTESTEGHTRKSETFDISSGSGPSPGSDNHDFELPDLLNGDIPNVEQKQGAAGGSKILEAQKSLNEKIKKIECELKRPDCEMLDQKHKDKSDSRSLRKNEKSNDYDLKDNQSGPSKTTGSSFVRLSDLDKTPARIDTSDAILSKEDRVTYRMSNSIPETSWIESKLVMSRSSGPVRTLSRKFTSVMTTSLPPKQKSPLEDMATDCEGEGIISESDLSSMQSSMGRSGAEGSTEETETSSLAGGKPYNRLGEDLLRMFLEEINPDVTIDVAGRRIRAHKCILSSRCQYFAAILSGGWVESAGNVIPLQGYSYNAVHFALCHIYSGESNIPDSISIVELATLADMLCLEGLKEVIGYTLKVKYCHLFHKPCQICAVGVLECMPLAAAYGLDEVYRKSLRWITRHFVRIWPCKAFATLPRELMDKCYHQHIVHMSTDNVLQTIMDCDKLLATLPNVRWAEPVFRLVSNLLETAVKFLSENFSGVLGNEKFQALGRELTWNISRLEDNFLAAADRLPPEQACKSYSKLHKMLATSQTDDPPSNMKWGQLFVDFLKKIQSRVEKCLVREATRAARTSSWLKMDLELRRRIQELACLVILPHETSKRPSRHSNFLKEPKAPSSRSTTSRSLDLRRVKLVITEHTDKTIKQATLVPQAKKVLNKPKSDPLERKVQEEKQAPSDSSSRPKSWPNKMEVKSRYLEPRNKSVTKETAPPAVQSEKVMVQQRRKIMISSSDSSRTSSPAVKRAVDKKPLAKIKLPIKKDVKALSSDSLTETNVSRVNNRKDTTSKSCGITRPESPTFKQKDTEIGLSVDSLAEPKKKSSIKMKTGKMDTSMSTDSLMTEITATPKSSTSNKLSPTLGRGINKTQVYDRTKKTSPPTQQRSPLTITRKPLRSLESSTAASRNRAVAVTPYQGSPNLRRNLLDAAKTPDILSKSVHQVASRTSPRQSAQTTSAVSNVIKRERKETLSNQQSLDSPSKRSSPKSTATYKVNKQPAAGVKKACKPGEDKVKTKCHNGEPVKQPTVGSRSGTFLKDEPTILKKADIKSSQANL